MIRDIMDAIANIISRGTLRELRREKQTARVSIDFGDGDPVEMDHYEPWGFAYNPAPGSEALLISPRGRRDYAYSFLVHDRRRKRPPLDQGESALHAGEKVFVRASETRGLDLVAPKMNLSTEGEMTAKASSISYEGETLKLKGRSLKILNADNNELFALMSEVMTLLSTLTVDPDKGFLIKADAAQKFILLKQKFDRFK